MFAPGAPSVELEIISRGPLKLERIEPGVPCQPPDKFRVVARFSIGELAQGVAPFEFIVDTGTPFTLLPRRIWKDFESQIRFLGSNGITGIGGASIAVRLGLVNEIRIFEAIPIDGASTVRYATLRDVFAWCALDDADNEVQPLLGLGGRALECGGLCLNFLERKAHLVFG